MNDTDPYGLPTFPGEDVLDGWVDHSEIQLRDVRVFTRGSLTATLISHPGVWDVIVSDGAGNVEFLVADVEDVAPTLYEVARRY